MKSGVSPATLIAVAIITALSSLLAAAISAGIAYLVAKRNLTHAADMAALDREAKRREQHRAAQRDAYAAYLTASLAAYRAAWGIFRGKRNITVESWPLRRAETERLLEELVIALSVVHMEGTPDVVKPASDVREIFQLYWGVVQTTVDPSEEVDSIRSVAEQSSREMYVKTDQRIAAYAEAARLSLAE